MGDNIQDDVWNQPLNPMQLTEAGSKVFMDWTRIPNSQPSRTDIRITGTRASITCE